MVKYSTGKESFKSSSIEMISVWYLTIIEEVQ